MALTVLEQNCALVLNFVSYYCIPQFSFCAVTLVLNLCFMLALNVQECLEFEAMAVTVLEEELCLGFHHFVAYYCIPLFSIFA